VLGALRDLVPEEDFDIAAVLPVELRDFWLGADLPLEMSQAHDNAQAVATKALILNAGRGRRLDSLTGGRPTTHLPVPGVPILDRTLATLFRAGIRDAVITVAYAGDLVRGHVGDGARFGLRVRFACNDEWGAATPARRRRSAAADRSLPAPHGRPSRRRARRGGRGATGGTG
jgi:hypothetical protein